MDWRQRKTPFFNTFSVYLVNIFRTAFSLAILKKQLKDYFITCVTIFSNRSIFDSDKTIN